MNRDTQTQRENEKKRTHEKHTHNVNVYTTYISLPRCVPRPKTRTRAPISTISRTIKSSYNESDMCQQDFCHILSVSDNSVQVRVPDTDRIRKSRNQWDLPNAETHTGMSVSNGHRMTDYHNSDVNIQTYMCQQIFYVHVPCKVQHLGRPRTL